MPDQAKLDQSFTELHNLSCEINEGYSYVAQTYVAGINGMLCGVSVDITSRANANKKDGYLFEQYKLIIDICDVKGGYPSEILTRVILDSGESTINKILPIKEGINQVAGKQYAIVAHYKDAPPAGPNNHLGNWRGATGNRYPNGELLYGPDGKIWFASSIQNHDVHFCTFVIPA